MLAWIEEWALARARQPAIVDVAAAKSGAMTPFLVSMCRPGICVSGGGHDSDGWEVDTPWHYHDMHQILHAFDGSVEVEDQYGRHTIPHLFAAWIPSGAVHRTRIQKVRSGSMFLAADLVQGAGDRLRVIQAPGLLREMVAFARRWPLSRSDDHGREFFVCAASLCPEWISDEVELSLPTCTDPPMQVVIQHTQRNLASATLAQVCRAAALSERSLRRKFVAATGLTWEAYRRRMRMLAAMDMLEASRLTVGQVAAEVGYDNQSAFAKAFRQIVGISPLDYRRSRS